MDHTTCLDMVERRGSCPFRESNSSRPDRYLWVFEESRSSDKCGSSAPTPNCAVLAPFIFRRHACCRYSFISADLSVGIDILFDLSWSATPMHAAVSGGSLRALWTVRNWTLTSFVLFSVAHTERPSLLNTVTLHTFWPQKSNHRLLIFWCVLSVEQLHYRHQYWCDIPEPVQVV